MAVERTAESRRARPDRHSVLTAAVCGAAVIAVVIVRLQAAPAPLERDEGEYALMGRLILHGVPPYGVAANMKFPGTYYAYSAIMAFFGQTPEGIHTGLLVVNLLSTLMLYLLARRLLGQAAAAMASAAFIITSVDNSVLGLFAHASQFVVLFAIAGIWLLLERSRSKRSMPLLWASGLCLGLSVLMIQSGAFFALFGLVWFIFEALRRGPVNWKRFFMESGALAAGIVLPFAAVLALVAHEGLLHNFWFWTIRYAFAYTSEVGLKAGFENFTFTFMPIIEHWPVIWGLALAGLIGAWCTESGRKAAPFLLAFLIFSFLSVCPGLYFRPHYFVQLLPSIALFAGTAVMVVEKTAAKYTSRSRTIQFAAFAVAAGLSLITVFSTSRALAAMTPAQFSHSVYGGNPFPESVRVAQYIRKRTNPGDHIAVLGSEPQIYFYAHRKPATQYIYMYPLMENQPFALRMQEQLIRQVEKSKPPFIVLATAPTSWLARPRSHKLILVWMKLYLEDYYKPVLIADIYRDGTVWLQGGEVLSPAYSPSRLIVFKRKTGR